MPRAAEKSGLEKRRYGRHSLLRVAFWTAGMEKQSSAIRTGQ
jgi:hypothetical protein